MKPPKVSDGQPRFQSTSRLQFVRDSSLHQASITGHANQIFVLSPYMGHHCWAMPLLADTLTPITSTSSSKRDTVTDGGGQRHEHSILSR